MVSAGAEPKPHYRDARDPGTWSARFGPRGKRDGRLGPPEGYPKDSDRYANPATWKYPVPTPFQAHATRRYFDKPGTARSVLSKCSLEEQAYVDRKINAALRRFGIAVAGASAEGPEAGTIQTDVPIDKDIERMDLDELLGLFLDKGRIASARELLGER